MREFRVIIAGSRTFSNYELLKSKMDNILSAVADPVTIISGHCLDKNGNVIGADKLGEQYAYEKGYDLEMYPANWKRHGKAAGPFRNFKMANKINAHALVLFWDGWSKGSKNMNDEAINAGLYIRVIYYKKK